MDAAYSRVGIEIPNHLMETIMFLLEDYYQMTNCVAETEGEEGCTHCVLNKVFEELGELYRGGK